MKTKKVGSAGRYGVRYGLKLRRKIVAIEKKQRAKAKCPYCLKLGVKRVSCGIFLCPKCNVKFVGNAYSID